MIVNRDVAVMAATIGVIVASGITESHAATGDRVAINRSVLSRVNARRVRSVLRPSRRVSHESRVKPARNGRSVQIAANVVSDRNARVANVNRQRKPPRP